MRPILALTCVILLAGLLVGAFLLVRSDGGAGPIVPPPPAPVAATADSGQHALDPTGTAAEPESDRAKIAPALAPANAASQGVAGVRGRVVDPESRPVKGATVYADGANGLNEIALDEIDSGGPFSHRVQAVTDEQGRFTLQPGQQSAVRIAVRAPGFAPLDAEKPLSGGTTDLGDLKLDRGVVLMGRVIDAGGRAVEGAQLHRVRTPTGGLVMTLGSGPGGPVVATTDATGAFRVDQLAAGPWSLLVTSEDHPDKTAKGETDRAGQVVPDILVQLDRGATIAGRLTGMPADASNSLSIRATSSSGEGEGLEHMLGGLRAGRRGDVQPDGSFVVRGCREGAAYRLVARTKEREFGSAARSDAVDAQAGDRDVVLKYRSETALVFQVVDAESGRGIETLQVSAGFRWPMQLFEEGGFKPQTHFPEGRVRFASLPQPAEGDLGQLRVEATGYETWERKDLRILPGIDNDLGVIRLGKSALVHVTVLEAATNAPVAGARVTLNELSAGGSQRGRTFSVSIGGGDEDDGFASGSAHSGKTDAHGRVALSSMPGKRATLSVSQKEHARFTSAPIDLPLTGDHDETVRLSSGGTVVVQVRDSGGKPAAGLAIDHKTPDGEPATMLSGLPDDTVTDAQGQVTFPHVPAGTHLYRVRTQSGLMSFGGGVVMARASGNAALESEKGWNEALVVEGQTTTVDLVAPARGTLEGRVRESGKPLAGATVRLKPGSDDGPDFGFFDQGASAVTNAAGEYVLENVTAGDYRVTVTHPSRAMPWQGDTSVREGENRCDVDLSVAIVEGRISGEDGKPLAGVKVRAERARNEKGGEKRTSFQVMMINSDSDGETMSFGGDGAGAPPATSDSEGRYRLRGITPGIGIEIAASSAGVQPARSDRFELAPDQTRTGVDLVLKLGATIEVVTRRADGKPASGCIVHAEPVGVADAESKTQFVGATGRGTFSGVPPGHWRFTCTKAGLDTENAPKIPDQELDARVGPPATVTFDVP